ncbi:MAG TPA: cytochrome D ubiquinol oxidase subunit II, partial [Pirellulales bacterium]|nr:cytochrome D ubiquinol oxidase subunit II [Pirellulales bacterium]
HSMRYVRNKLLLRLQRAPDAALLDQINATFSDILVEGKFSVSDALPEERDDPTILALPRLVLRFNRRSLGRLRQLIDLLNGERSQPS